MSREEKFKEKAAEILRDNITFSPQLNNYVIHGALEKLWELHQDELKKLNQSSTIIKDYGKRQ